MTVNMLKAISKMLETPPNLPVLEFKARVECAKLMLDEIILGLQKREKTPAEIERAAELLVEEAPSIPKAPPKEEVPKPTPKPIPKDKRQIVLNDAKKIVRIDNFPLDGKVMLDGKIMTHKEAVGKTFTNGRFIE